MEDMRIYVASLSDYNDGRLEGKWLDLSDYSDASELMEAIQEMLDELTEKYKSIDGEVREEWAVHDYEGIPSTLASEYMGEQDFQQLYDIAEVAEDRGIPVEVLVERAGDTGSDDYQALADSLMFVVDGNDESDIVYEYEEQIGGLGNEFWSNHIYVDDVTERVMYGEDVDNFRQEILDENPDMDEDEAEREAEERADEEAERREDLGSYLEEMGYGDEIPSWVSKDYEGAWKRSLSYDFDVIHHDGEMYVFSNNYGIGGTILSGMVGAYIGYKYAENKKKGKKLFEGGGGVDYSDFEKSEHLTSEDFEKISKRIDAKELGRHRNLGTHKEFTNWWYNGGREIAHQKYGNDDSIAWEEAYEDFKNKYESGGGIGFKGLSAKVAKRYEGKKPEAKYRAEYGKRYSKSEAKEVGDKVAGKVYWQQKGRKMASGGGVSEKITKSRLKAKLYEPTGDFFIEDKGDKWFLHFTPKDASKNSSNLSDLNAKSVGNGYYGSAYSVDKVINHKYAHGGMTQHGLREGDKIIFDHLDDDKIDIIDRNGSKHIVDLDKGKRYEGGGKVIEEISTHKAVKKGDKIYIYIKGMPIENAEDRRLAKKYPHWFKDELIRTIPAENEDDLFYIFENYKEENRSNLSGYARGGGVENKKTTPSHIVKFHQDFAQGGLNTRMRSWYMKTFPQDERGQYMNLYNTFEDLWNALQNKQDVYNVIGEGDSLIRERLFDKLSQLKGVKYMDVYNLWLESDDDEYAQGGGVSGLEDLIRG